MTCSEKLKKNVIPYATTYRTLQFKITQVQSLNTE